MKRYFYEFGVKNNNYYTVFCPIESVIDILPTLIILLNLIKPTQTPTVFDIWIIHNPA